MSAKVTAAFRRSAAAAVLGAFFLVAAVCMACGSDGGSNDPYAGYWRVSSSGPAGYTLLAVRPSGGAYQVRSDTLGWHPAEIMDGRLRVQERYAEDSMFAPGLDLEAKDGKGVLLVGASPSPYPVALTRLSEAQYRTKLLAMADRELPTTLYMLSFMAREYAKTHGGRPPRVADMNADSALGRFIARRNPPLPWPLNPFTGEDMHSGSAPGDFSYTTDGQGFDLTAVSSDGSAVSPSLTPNL